MKKINQILSVSTMLLAGVAHAQLSTTENYVYSKTYLSDPTLPNVRTSETVQYFDGLGRPKQMVNVKASPLGKDVVTHIEYDAFGRQVKDYLPVPQSGTLNGAIVPTPLANVTNTPYGSEKIYAEKILENSPLDRVQQQIQVGNDWTGKPVKFQYDINVNGEVFQFTTNTTWVNNATSSVLSLPGTFPANQLYKTTVTDEDGNINIEYKNGKGQIIMARKHDGAFYNDTYYVYNEYDQLAFVLPQKALFQPLTDTLLNDLCYQYRYDGRNRLVEKKLPGKGWEYMVYDKQDRLVLTRDSNLEAKGQWLFTKYDQFSRPIYTGILDSAPGRIQQVNAIEGHGSNNEIRSTASWNNSGMDVYYTSSSAYPTMNFKLLSVNYYDTYPTGSSAVTNVFAQELLTDNPANSRTTKGMLTASYVKNIEDDKWTRNFIWYDTKGRNIGSRSNNHLGGYTVVNHKLDFAGVVLQTNTYHKRLGADVEKSIAEKFTYDSQNRLLTHTHQVGSNPVEYLTQNKYNELSQLESKKVGGIAVASPLQTIDYKYNIRGWMTQINDPVNLNGKLFGYKIKYIDPVYADIASGRYNGNIAEIDWNTSTVNNLKRYNYTYDKLNRLTDAEYAEPNTTNPHNKNFDERLTYDLNGNIASLKRNAFPVLGTTSTVVDNLVYQYTGNRLDKVIENALNDTGYEGGNNIIDYDLNGNMTTMKDKGIQNISYNYLNLPNTFSITQTHPFLGHTINYNIAYLYRADGVKLRKNYVNQGGRGTTTQITDYLDGFQYSYIEGGEPCLTCRTEFAFEEQAYKNINDALIIGGTPEWKLDFVPTSEGFYSFIENRYIYQYRDHLGNARVSFAKNNEGVLEVTDTNNYYPFGLNHIEGMFSTSKFGSYNSYKYNGKELQETGMYDYGARMYMPDLGRWGVLDNYSENYSSLSPYNYVAGNPIKYIDINGEWIYINDQNGTQYRYSNGATQHEVDGKWTNVDSSTNLSDYVTQTVAGLSYLDKNTSIGNTMINYFDQGQGKDGKTRDIYFNYTSGDSQVKYGISNIVDLKINNTKGVWTTSGRDIKDSPLYTTIAHEMGHVYGYFALGEVAQADNRFGPDSTTAEIYGTHVENIVRAETYLPLRTNYGSKCISSNCIPNAEGRLIDNAGSSIYYNSNGSQTTPIPSVQGVLNINNNILQNKYNYHGAAAFYHWQRFKNRAH